MPLINGMTYITWGNFLPGLGISSAICVQALVAAKQYSPIPMLIIHPGPELHPL